MEVVDRKPFTAGPRDKIATWRTTRTTNPWQKSPPRGRTDRWAWRVGEGAIRDDNSEREEDGQEEEYSRGRGASQEEEEEFGDRATEEE